jgi:hypothetical protein
MVGGCLKMIGAAVVVIILLTCAGALFHPSTPPSSSSQSVETSSVDGAFPQRAPSPAISESLESKLQQAISERDAAEKKLEAAKTACANSLADTTDYRLKKKVIELWQSDVDAAPAGSEKSDKLKMRDAAILDMDQFKTAAYRSDKDCEQARTAVESGDAKIASIRDAIIERDRQAAIQVEANAKAEQQRVEQERQRKEAEAIAAQKAEADAASAAEADAKAKAEAEANRPGPTMARYSAVKADMTYAQVKAIMKQDGKELSSSSIGGYTTVMVEWDGDWGANMNVTFQNGRVIGKAQFGLR